MAKRPHPAWISWLGTDPPDTSIKDLDRWLKPSLWRGVGWCGDQLWGEARTKGSLYYKVCLDRKSMVSSCTCSNRLKPCAHIAALAFGYEEGFWRDEEPYSPPEWLAPRLESATQTERVLPDPPAAKKDLLQLPPGRREELQAGFEYLSKWLEDQTSLGWRQVLEPGSAQSMEAAARLVDHRMPGPAGLIRRMGTQEGSAQLQSQGLTQLAGRLLLACRVFQAGERHRLWPALMLFCGMTIRKDNLRKQSPPVEDRWLILGVQESEEDGLRGRNSWAWGTTTGSFAHLLDFAWGKAPLPPGPPTGTLWAGHMHFYPGEGNFRAVMGDVTGYEGTPVIIPDTWLQNNALLCRYLSQDPWRAHQPTWVGGLRFVQEDGKWTAVDRETRRMDLYLSGASAEELGFLAPSGSMSVFGLHTDGQLWPWSVGIEGKLIPLPSHDPV